MKILLNMSHIQKTNLNKNMKEFTRLIFFIIKLFSYSYYNNE